jgi:hypothetical protein
MADPASPAPISSSKTTTIKILEVPYALRAVTDQTVALLNTTRHVERNIREAKRLFALHSSLLTPQEHSWIIRSITDTEHAVGDVAKLIEPARVNIQADRGVGIKNRAVWVFRDSLKVGEKMALLNVTHQTLGAVISALHAKAIAAQDRSVGETHDHEARNAIGDVSPPSYEWSEFLAWQRRRSSKTKRPKSGGAGFETQVRGISATQEGENGVNIQTPNLVSDPDHGTQAAPLKEAVKTSHAGLSIDPPSIMTLPTSVAELPCPLSPPLSELEASEVRELCKDQPIGRGDLGFIRKSAPSTFSVPEISPGAATDLPLRAEIPRGLPPSTMKKKNARSLSNSWLAYQASRGSFELPGSGAFRGLDIENGRGV